MNSLNSENTSQMNLRSRTCMTILSKIQKECGKGSFNMEEDSVLHEVDYEKIQNAFEHPTVLGFKSREELKKLVIELIDYNDVSKLMGVVRVTDNPQAIVKLKLIDGKTSMHYAAKKNSKEVLMSLIILNNNDVDLVDNDDETPLFAAVRENKIANFVVMYVSGANVHHLNSSGMNLLSVAVSHCHPVMIKLLIELNVNINHQDVSGWSPLMWCVDCEKNVECAKVLLENNANPNLTDYEGNNMLHWIILSGKVDILSLLLPKFDNVDIKNESGDTPLHLAARSSKFQMMNFLLKVGADPMIYNNKQESAIMLCRDREFRQQMVEKRKLSLKYYYYLPDLSYGREALCVPVINTIDTDKPAPFTYITRNYENCGALVNRQLCSFEGCACVGDCVNNPECSCRCLSENGQIWYQDGLCKIDEISQFERPLIFECNVKCKCSMKCSNRMVQFDLRIPLELFKTADKGWAVRTMKDLMKGLFISQYTGEVITDKEADERVNDDSYLFDLDTKEVPHVSKCVDAKYYGNISRFYNHSCDPNMTPIRVFFDHHDVEAPTIAFFANRQINHLEELTFDYGDKFWEVKKVNCLCQTAKCKYSKKFKG